MKAVVITKDQNAKYRRACDIGIAVLRQWYEQNGKHAGPTFGPEVVDSISALDALARILLTAAWEPVAVIPQAPDVPDRPLEVIEQAA